MKLWFAVLYSLLLVACAGGASGPPTPVAPPPAASPGEVSFQTILPVDAVRALDQPPALPAADAAPYIGPMDMVMGMEIAGEARAYPIGLMSRYEVANDTLGGKAIAVTFCPLCNSGVAFSRTVQVGGEPRDLTFGVSGKLMDEALVMLDRQTGSLWAQSRLKAVEGELAGSELELLVTSQVPWQEWRSVHPGTTVVVDEAAMAAGSTFVMPSLPGAPASADPAPSPSSVTGYVLGVLSASSPQAVPLALVEQRGVINGASDGGVPYAIVTLGEPGEVMAWQRLHEGQTLTFELRDGTLVDEETGSEWDRRTGLATAGPLAGTQLQSFPTMLTHWLGWYDLYPNTAIVGG